MAASASSEPVSCYSETVAGDDDCRTSSYAEEKDDYIDEFITTRAQDTSTKCKRRKLRDIPVSDKVSGVLDRIKTSIRTPTMISVLNEVCTLNVVCSPYKTKSTVYHIARIQNR